MFQPETEDMLPRMAPKPNTMTEAVVMPQVPEVSILYGQDKTVRPESQQQQQHQHQQQSQQMEQQKPFQTYANWRKQMLPRATTFSPTLEHESQQIEQVLQSPRESTNPMPTINHNGKYILDLEHNNVKSTVYPFRMMAVPNINTHSVTGTVKPLATSGAAFNCNSRGIQQMQSYDIVNYPNTCYGQQQQVNRKPLEMAPPSLTPLPSTPPSIVPQVKSNNHQRDILTICAGTQTDSPSMQQQQQQCGTNIMLQKVASKEDVEHLRTIVQNIREEQMRLLQICETILINQTMIEQKPLYKDASIQAEINSNDDYGAVEDNMKAHVSIPSNNKKTIQQQQNSQQQQQQHFNVHADDIYHQTSNDKAMAQSAGYRANATQVEHNKMAPIVLPKPTTEKSLIMTELAFKYLATDKLTELFQECKLNSASNNNSHNIININNSIERMQQQQQQQLSERNVNNMEKSPPIGISNSSYKYLKKYRLIPEDYVQMENRTEVKEIPNTDNVINNDADDIDPVLMGNEKRINASPLLHHVQVPTQKYSLSSYHLKYGSPLAASPSAKHYRILQTMNDEQILDLDNIKQQPKLL